MKPNPGNASGGPPKTVGPPQASDVQASEVIKELAEAQQRLQKDRIAASNPSLWTRGKEVFSPGSKNKRTARIKDAERFDKIIDEAMRLVAQVQRALVDPRAQA